MRSNDIELTLRTKGYEKGVREILFRQGEELQDAHNGLRELAKLIDQLSNVMMMQTSAMESLKKHVERADDDPRSTRELVDGQDND